MSWMLADEDSTMYIRDFRYWILERYSRRLNGHIQRIVGTDSI